MDSIITTPRLKLSVMGNTNRGSQELQWVHQLRSDEKVTWWSHRGTSKTIEDTEIALENFWQSEGATKSFSAMYAVHEVESSSEDFVGLIVLRTWSPTTMEVPAHMLPPSALSSLVLEVGYQFAPTFWNRGFATESLNALFGTFRRGPWPRLYITAVVNDGNVGSLRVAEKVGMERLGEWEQEGRVQIAGKWREGTRLVGWGRFFGNDTVRTML